MHSRHLQGAYYPCLLKLHFVKKVNYVTSVCGDVAACIGRVLVDVCMSHCSGVDCSSLLKLIFQYNNAALCNT